MRVAGGVTVAIAGPLSHLHGSSSRHVSCSLPASRPCRAKRAGMYHRRLHGKSR
jgi:hypothetical protein